MIISDIGMMKKQTQTFITMFLFFVLYHLMPSGIFKTRNFGMGVFWGFNFWSGDFLAF